MINSIKKGRFAINDWKVEGGSGEVEKGDRKRRREGKKCPLIGLRLDGFRVEREREKYCFFFFFNSLKIQQNCLETKFSIILNCKIVKMFEKMEKSFKFFLILYKFQKIV